VGVPSLNEITPPPVVVTRADDPWPAVELATFREHNGREVRLNAAGLLEPATLFRAFAREMSFPNYFGHNWDVLVDCLSDPTLLTASTAVLVDDAELLLGAQHLSLFIAVLCQAARRVAFDPARPVMHLVLLLDEMSPAQIGISTALTPSRFCGWLSLPDVKPAW
jgi:RNAse (barnase) inhibitor barstar